MCANIYFIKWWILGRPFYHMWYLYMIIGLYILVPVIINLKEKISEKIFLKLSIYMVFLGVIVHLYQNLFWMIQWIIYLGYFMLGNSLKNYFEKRKININICIMGYIISSGCIFFLTEFIVKNNLLDRKFYFYDNLSPFVIVGSISIYILFLKINLQETYLSKISKYTFDIYLVHAGILSIINLISDKFLKINFNGLWYIPLMSIIIFFISLYFSIFLEYIKNYINIKFVKIDEFKNIREKSEI